MSNESEKYGKLPELSKKYYLQALDRDENEESNDEEDAKVLNEALGTITESLETKSHHEIDLSNQMITPKLNDEQFPRILFLGTGAADSYHLRNSTGILVHITYVYLNARQFVFI